MVGNNIREIWKQAAQGDKEAENEIFRRLAERFTVIASLSICREDAEDLAHETCLSVLKGYKNLGSPYEYGAWAQKILKNNLVDYFKKRASEKKLFAESEFSEQHDQYAQGADNYDLMIILKECLKKLSLAYPPYARALSLRQSGYDTESICGRMKITRNNLYVMLNRGRSFLRKCIFEGESD